MYIFCYNAVNGMSFFFCYKGYQTITRKISAGSQELYVCQAEALFFKL